MKTLVVLIAMLVGFSMTGFAQQTKKDEQQKQQSDKERIQEESQKDDNENIELFEDPRKSVSARPPVVKPTGKVCKDSLLREINGMDIPNEGQFPNPANPNGENDGTLNNNNGELPERMNCNAINDIAPRQEPVDDPIEEGYPLVKDPE